MAQILVGQPYRRPSMAKPSARLALVLLLGTGVMAGALRGNTRLSEAGISPPQAERDASTLAAHVPLARSISTGDRHSYRLDLTAGDYVRIVVAQEDIDVGVSLLAPDGSSLVDLAYRTAGPRTACAIAGSSGSHLLQIQALETRPLTGRYVVEVADRRPATPADRFRVRAVHLAAEAEALWAEERAEAASQALVKSREAFDQWKAAGDAAGQASAARWLATAHQALGQLDLATGNAEQAVALSQQAADATQECASLVVSSVARLYAGMTDAGEYGQQALELSRRTGNRRCEGAALNALGDVYSFSGRSVDALGVYGQALSVSRALRDRRIEAEALLNLGYVDADLSRVSEAQASYEAALAVWRALGDRRGQARTLIGLAQLFGITGEKQRALGFYREARALVEAQGDRLGLAIVLSGMGAAHLQLGDASTATGYYQSAVSLFRSAKVPNGEAANLLFLGISLAATGRREEALAQQLQALAITRTVADRRLEALALGDLGRLYAEMGRADEALERFEQAVSLARTVGDRRGETRALTGTAELLHRLGRDDETVAPLHEALRLATLGKDRFAESQALFVGSRIEAARNNLEGALEKVRASRDLVEGLRANVASLDLRASYLASVRDRYELEIEILSRLHERNTSAGYEAMAFETSERARARSLMDGLAATRAGIREGVDASLLEQEAAQSRLLNAMAERLMRTPRGGSHEKDAVALEHQIDALTNTLQDVRARIRAESPRYAALTEPQPLSASEIQRHVVDDESVLLEYFLGGRRSYVWAVTSEGIAGFALPARDEIARVVRRFRDAVATPPGAGSAEEPDATQALDVSRMLLGPVSAHLGKPRLLVVADGILESLPFAALPDPRGPAGAAPSVPLVVGHEIVHLPSASTLALIRGAWQTDRRWTRDLMIFADPVFEVDDPRLAQARSTRPPSQKPASATVAEEPPTHAREPVTRDVDPFWQHGIPRLIESRREAERIAALAPGAQVALGFEASRAGALDTRLADYRIVHFATHAIVDSERPELSGIVLSLFDRAGKPQDGFLRLHDVYNLHLPVDLVVLSACSSALGKQVTGEGLISLVRGFMYAQSRRVVASLWKVDDEATGELMTRLYAGMLTKGLAPPAALRAAQVELMTSRRWRHPFYWAAFVVAGDWQ